MKEKTSRSLSNFSKATYKTNLRRILKNKNKVVSAIGKIDLKGISESAILPGILQFFL